MQPTINNWRKKFTSAVSVKQHFEDMSYNIKGRYPKAQCMAYLPTLG